MRNISNCHETWLYPEIESILRPEDFMTLLNYSISNSNLYVVEQIIKKCGFNINHSSIYKIICDKYRKNTWTNKDIGYKITKLIVSHTYKLPHYIYENDSFSKNIFMCWIENVLEMERKTQHETFV